MTAKPETAAEAVDRLNPWLKPHVESFVDHDDYLRRNLLVAKAIGARAAARTALERLRTMRRPPKWIVAAFESIEVRCDALPGDLAAWRDLVGPTITPQEAEAIAAKRKRK